MCKHCQHRAYAHHYEKCAVSGCQCVKFEAATPLLLIPRFEPGEVVRLSWSLFPERIGIKGVVITTVKSRGVVRFRVEHTVPTYGIKVGDTYEAEPESLTKEAK